MEGIHGGKKMRWKYSFISFEDGVYRYSYIRENAAEEGIISYNTFSGRVEVEKMCSIDDSEYCREKAIEHFYKVINENFPKERKIWCG